MKLSSFLNAWATIVPRHKTRRGLNKRLPPKPRISSPASFIQLDHYIEIDAEEAHALSQQPAEEQRAPATSTPPTAPPPCPSKTAPPHPPRGKGRLPLRPNPPSRPLSPTPPSCPSPPLCEKQKPASYDQEEHGSPVTEGSTSSCSSETAVPSNAEGDPHVAPERLGLIAANLRGPPIPEVEPSEPRLASTTKEQLETATEIDTGARTNPDYAAFEDIEPDSQIPPVDSSIPILPAPFLSPETIEEGPDFELAGSMYPLVAPMIPPLTDEDRDALAQYLAQADDDQDHNMSLATLPHDDTNDSAPPSIAKDEENHLNRQAEMGLAKPLWDNLFASSDTPFPNKRKRSKQLLLHSHTHLSGIAENPLWLSTMGFVTDDEDDVNEILVFAFCGRSLTRRSQTVNEALDDFEAFLLQHSDVQRLELTFSVGVRFPADFIAHAMAKAQKHLARFTHVEILLESAAAQSQATWAWPPQSKLQFLRLEGIARGARLPLTQLQQLSMTAEVKSFEVASFLSSLPQLRVLSLCIGRTGSKKAVLGRIVLPQLQRLELTAKVDPAAFLSRLDLPALRNLDLSLDIVSDEDIVDYGKGVLKCNIPWHALNDVVVDGPSAGRETLWFLHQLFRGDGPGVVTQCRLSRDC